MKHSVFLAACSSKCATCEEAGVDIKCLACDSGYGLEVNICIGKCLSCMLLLDYMLDILDGNNNCAY